MQQPGYTSDATTFFQMRTDRAICFLFISKALVSQKVALVAILAPVPLFSPCPAILNTFPFAASAYTVLTHTIDTPGSTGRHQSLFCLSK